MTIVSPSVIFGFPIMSVLLPKASSLTNPKEYDERRINGSIVKQDQIMDAIIADYPQYYQLRIWSGDIKNGLDVKASEKRWEEALELNPGSYEALTSLVFLHIESGASTMLPANDRDLEKAKAYFPGIIAFVLSLAMTAIRFSQAAHN